MIREVAGDIIESKAEAIAHGVAPGDDFHQGLALSLREHWPAMYRDFRHYCRQSNPQVGEVWAWRGVGGAWIYALFTQDPPPHEGGKPGKASLSHVAHALKALARDLKDKGIKSVALPKLATGVGGLAWDDVAKEIDKVLGKAGFEVILYTQFRKGVRADELAAPART